MRTLLFFCCLLAAQCGPKKNDPGTKVNPSSIPEETSVAVPDTIKAPEETPEVPGPKVPDYDTAQWQEITRLDPTIRLDLRYATDNNFVEEKMYDCGRCFLRPEVAVAVVAAHRELQKKGFGLKMYDCYRPRPIQWKLWNKVPDTRYVADPRKGSMHNRGMAVDLTITDSKGTELDMGTEFDFFGQEAYHSYGDHPQNVTDNRVFLLETMEEHGFRPTSTEWWHYSYKPKTFPLDDWLWPCE